MTPAKPLVAFAVDCKQLGSVGIYGATTRSVARMRALAGALNAGYGFRWTDFSARRARAFDPLIAKHGMVCWSNEHAARMLESQEPKA